MPKRYIEDVLPLGELNKYAQKGGGIGSLNAMHPYFARRPLTASRAMTLAAQHRGPSFVVVSGGGAGVVGIPGVSEATNDERRRTKDG